MKNIYVITCTDNLNQEENVNNLSLTISSIKLVDKQAFMILCCSEQFPKNKPEFIKDGKEFPKVDMVLEFHKDMMVEQFKENKPLSEMLMFHKALMIISDKRKLFHDAIIKLSSGISIESFNVISGTFNDKIIFFVYNEEYNTDLFIVGETNELKFISSIFDSVLLSVSKNQPVSSSLKTFLPEGNGVVVKSMVDC